MSLSHPLGQIARARAEQARTLSATTPALGPRNAPIERDHEASLPDLALALVALVVCSGPGEAVGRPTMCMCGSRLRSVAPAPSARSASSRRSSRRLAGRLAVRFFVDGTLLRTITRASLCGGVARRQPVRPLRARRRGGRLAGTERAASVVLEPFEVAEASEVTSVLLEAGVYDKKGQFIGGLRRPTSRCRKTASRSRLDLVDHERIPAIFALLIDSSQSMSRRFDFVKDAAGRLTQFLRPKDRVLVAPFSKHLQAITGPTADRQTVVEAIDAISRQEARRSSTRWSSSASACPRAKTGAPSS